MALQASHANLEFPPPCSGLGAHTALPEDTSGLALLSCMCREQVSSPLREAAPVCITTSPSPSRRSALGQYYQLMTGTVSPLEQTVFS